MRVVAREVSCLALTFFFDYLESHDHDPEQLLIGLPLSPDELRDRSQWMDYETFLAIEGRVAALFPDKHDLFFDIGRSFASTQGFGFMRVVGRAVVSPFQVYAQIPRMVPRFLFPFVDIAFERLGPDRMRGTYTFTRGYPPTDAFVDTVRGILTAVPLAVGAPEARVEMVEREEFVAVFELEFQRWPGPIGWLKGTFEQLRALFRIRLRNLGEAAAELEETNVLLQEKVDALEEAKGRLDVKVRDLVVLNRIALAAARERDPRQLAREIVSLISKEFGGGGVAVLLRDGEQERLVPVARRAVPLEVFGDVVRTVRRHVDRPSFADTLLRLEEFEAWVLPLAGAEGALGALFVQSEDDDRALLESVARQLGVAFDNALAYRLVNELRTSLEIRVKERTAQLEEARAQLEQNLVSLEEANQAKERFFTNVSHELKTPLTLVLGPLEHLLASQPEDPAVAAELATARSNAVALRHMVEELLDFSRLDAGRLQARTEAFDLAELLDEQVGRYEPLAEREDVALRVGDVERPLSVEGDVELLRRVVSNLVGNAIKYVGQGDSIEVSGQRDGDEVRFLVRDTGPGIPEDQAEQVFERFHRAAGEDGREVPGSGIGLAMCREIVELHGGTIGLGPTPGGGATFEVTLPAIARDAPLVDIPAVTFHDADEQLLDERQVDLPLAPAPAQRERILLVEDNRDMRNFLVRLLERRWTLEVARDGETGLEMARAQPPDLVVSDVMMPRMNGYELCRALKADPLTKGVPVILVSARGGGDAALDGFAAGASDYVVKPFSPPELLARVDAQIQLRRLTLALIEAEKRASLAAMSAGIAHEVLNPVNVIANSVGLLARMPSEEGSPQAQLLGLISDATDRIQRVVEATLRLARRDDGPGRVEDIDLVEQVAGLLPLLKHRQGKVRLDVDVADAGTFVASPELVDQLVMNLLSNAFDAVDPDVGQVWLSARREPESVAIVVRDDGPGIPPELRELVFAPFFTTKDPGSGTGLGLALCKELVAVHGGELSLGHPARGAEVVARLPLVASAPGGEHDGAERRAEAAGGDRALGVEA